MDLSSKQKKTLVDVAEEFLLLQFSVLVESVALYSFVSCFFLVEFKMDPCSFGHCFDV